MDDTNANKTDEELVLLSLKDQAFYGYLMRRYEKSLARYVRRIMPSAGESVDDVLQEVFIKTYLHLNAFNHELKFSSWIYRIAHNHVVSEMRKNFSRPRTVSLDGSEYGVFALRMMDESANSLGARYAKEEVEFILGTLKQEYRDVLVLRFLEGLEYSEISDILKVPISSVGTLLNRAKAQFKKEYEKRYGKTE